MLEYFAQAESRGFSPLNDTEMYPKLEALIMTNDWNGARQLSDRLLEEDPTLFNGLCAIWERSSHNNPPGETDRPMVEELITILDCPELLR